MFSLSRVRAFIYANISIILRITLLFSTIVFLIRSNIFPTCSNVFLFVQKCANNPSGLP